MTTPLARNLHNRRPRKKGKTHSTEDEGVDEEQLVSMIVKEMDSEEESLRTGSKVEVNKKLYHLPKKIWRMFERMLGKKDCFMGPFTT